MRTLFKALIVVLASITAPTLAAAETIIDAKMRETLSVTVYGNGLGLVYDDRRVMVNEGSNLLALEDIATAIIPESLMIAGQDFSVQERRFDFNLLTPQALLEKSLGQTVFFLRTNEATGEEQLLKARILSTQGGLVIERDGRIETGQPGRLVLERLPDGLRARPALLANIEATRAGTVPFEMGYLTNGLSWKSDYVARLSEDGDSLTLSALASITNTSGADYEAAAFKLVAGSVNRQSPQRPVQATMMRAEMATASVADAAPPAPEALGGVHVYSLLNALTLGHQETRQVSLLDPVSLPLKRTHLFSWTTGQHRGGEVRQNARLQLEFDNSLALPLPAGQVRLYEPLSDGSLQFTGEDRIGDTPEGESVKLHPGQSFDVTARRTQTSFDRAGLRQGGFEAAYEVTFKNAGEALAAIEFSETLWGDWEILEETLAHSSKTATEAKWRFDLPGGAEKTVTFKVRVQR